MMIKNTYIKSILLTVFAISIIGCSEDFLDKTPVEQISVSDVEKTGEVDSGILEATLRGIYTMMYQTGTGGTGRHEDFGQKGYDIYGDMLSSDVALVKNTYSRYRNLAQLVIPVDYTYTQGNYEVWRYYYRVIRSCNLVITSLGGNDAPITDANRSTMGQAKGLRAYAYFYLSQYYIPEYSETSTILPLYIDSSDPENKPQSTTKEVYDLMISDLESSIALLDAFTRTQKYEMNKDVAKSLLAYVYGSMGTSAANLKAKTLAEEVIGAGYPLTTMAQSTGGFNNVNTPSWIWGVDITVDAGLNLVSWWGQMDRYSYSYQYFGDRKGIDATLFDAIKPNDVRKTQFSTITSSAFYLTPIYKFYDAARQPAGASTTTTSDYIYMRIDEMYLLSAEMSAKEGLDGDARNRLKNILALRFTNPADYAYIDALSGAALQNEVYLQTRIEFWGEGKSYLAMKRNKATNTRGANHVYLKGVSIPYNDDRLTFDIPQSEIQNNPFINR
jgi:hypothetical protein